MKKCIILVFIMLLSGCSVVRIDTKDPDNIVDVVLSKNNTLYNKDGQGYKYYIPNGVNYIDTDDLVQTLYFKGEYLYLYVDIVSYYYKTDINFTNDNSLYFSKRIKNGNKDGYLTVDKQDDLYYVNFYYNYARIEALVSYENLNNTILNASYILSTIKYNRNIIKTMLEENYLVNRTGKYDLFKTTDKTEKFVLEKDKEGE